MTTDDNERLRFIRERLSHLLIISPLRAHPEPEQERHTLGPALALGARYSPTTGTSDVAFARNLCAAKARQALARLPDVEHILLLDGDNVADPLQLAQLIELVERARRQCRAPMVLGEYVVREEPWRAAALPVVGAPPITVMGGEQVGSDEATVPLYPCSGGLGCAVLRAETFIELVETSQTVEETIRLAPGEERQRLPVVCYSGIFRATDGRFHWASEDSIWCERIRELGGECYLARHIRVGHVRVNRQVLVPTSATDFGESRSSRARTLFDEWGGEDALSTQLRHTADQVSTEDELAQTLRRLADHIDQEEHRLILECVRQERAALVRQLEEQAALGAEAQRILRPLITRLLQQEQPK